MLKALSSMLLILLIVATLFYPLNDVMAITSATSVTTTGEATDQHDPQPSVLTLIPLWEAPTVGLDRAFLIVAPWINKTKLVLFAKNFAITDYSGEKFAVDDNGGYIYTIDGKLVKEITAEGIYDSHTGIQLYPKFGWLSGNGRYAVEDPNKYGTNAIVIDLETGQTISVDWGDMRPVSGTYPRGGHIWVRMDYTGNIIAVGEADPNGRLLVYEYDPSLGKYVRIYTSHEYGYWRMIQVSWDGTYIVGGVYDLNYTFIFKRDGNTYKLIAQLPLKGGHASVTFTDPKNLGYILVGTTNGYAHIFKFDPSTDTAVEIWSGRVGTATGRVYSCTIVTQSTASLSFVGFRAIDGDAIVVDLNTKTVIFQDVVEVGESVSVSPAGDYIVLGQRVYMVVKSDVQSKHPRVRFWGTMTFERGYQDLGTPLVLEAPERDWHLYFYDGRLTVKRIYVEPIPVDLVEDMDIQNGRLSKMLAKGLISAETFYTENAEVRELEVIPGSEVADVLREGGIENPDNYVATLSMTHFTPPPYFWEGHAWIGTVIHVPLDKPVNVYDDIMLQISTSIHTTSLAYDKNKRALGVLGIPVEIVMVRGKTWNRYCKTYSNSHITNRR